MKSTYLLIDLCTVTLPFLFSFHPAFRFRKYFKAFFISNMITAMLFIVWDAVFVAQGVWGFSNRYTLGPRIAGLPPEEILFFICIPFACIFTYQNLQRRYTIRWSRFTERTVVTLTGLFLLGGAVLFYDKAYTAITGFSCCILLLFLEFVSRVKWLPVFFSAYLILLIPFIIVNGLLTGFSLQEPVVWYNNSQNTGFRVLTIPVEDFFYGMELLLINIFFYEMIKKNGTGKQLRKIASATGKEKVTIGSTKG
jgi:lycopene cyclase domain-containing protein